MLQNYPQLIDQCLGKASMPDQSVTTPTITAEILGITPVTLRRWCDYHGAHLSTGANPPAGQARRFNGRDLEVLKTVKQLREQGLTVASTNDQIGKLTFAEIDTTDPQPDQPQALAAVQESAHNALAPTVAQDYIITVERRVGALERRRLDNVTAIGLGFVGGLLFAAILIGLAALYGSN